MPDTLTILRQRRLRRDNSRRSAENNIQRAALGIGFVVSVLLAAAILGAALAWADLTRDLPSVELLPALLDPQTGSLLQPTRLYDRTDGQVIAVLAPTDAPRNYTPLADIPPFLRQATLAALDPTFEEHPGYLLGGLDEPDKHPTLAQRLAADLLLWDEPPGPRRAIRERLLAAQITDIYGRDQVLEWFLNSANYGNHAYGIDAAARLYFGKAASELTSAESALLAGTSRAPALNPLDSPQDAPSTQRDIARLMLDGERATAKDAAQAASTRVDILPAQTPPNLSPAFSELVLTQLGEQFSPQRIAHGGLNITTTLDADLQKQVDCAIRSQLDKFSGTNSNEQDCTAAQNLPALTSSDISNPTLAAIITDPRTGEVLAYSGETRKDSPPAGMTERQIGSLVNPFIYFTALARAGQSPASMVWDIPDGLSGQVEPQAGEYHGPVRLRTALASGLFTPTAELLNQLGAPQVARTAQYFGQTLPASQENLLAGDALTSLPGLARAFSVFANGGVLAGQTRAETIELLTVLKVEGVDHNAWNLPASRAAQAVTSPQLAYLMTDMLRDPIARRYAPGVPAALDTEQAAALTGASADGRETWVAGYTPDRVVVSWLGSDTTADPAAAQGLWRALTLAAAQGLPASNWTTPQGIVQAEVCEKSGLLPTIYCPETVREVFLEENKPLQYDNLYRAFPINRETGLLATSFTSPALVDEQVFMLVPEQAREWAKLAGLGTPPDTYDTIQVDAPSPDVRLTVPEMFANVRGKVTVKGTAAGEGFQSYRLEAGEGINPRRWLAVAESTATVTDGTLGEWDTSGLDGLYTLRLSVVRADQQLETDTVMVTVDNISPTISLNFSQDGATLNLSENKEFTIFPVVTDNVSVASVDFFMDGKLLEKRTAAPFAIRWQATEGGHTLRIIASDAAGNQAEESITFTVAK